MNKQMKMLFSAVVAGIVVGAFGLLSVATAQDDDLFRDASANSKITNSAVLVGVLNLKTGLAQIKNAQMSIWQSPVDSNGDGFYEMVLKVTLPPTGFRHLCLLLDYEGNATGYTLNIGDSATNNGNGGDSSTQQRDAEMQIVGNDVSVFASDVGGGPSNASRIAATGLSLRNGGLKVCVSDMFLSYGNTNTVHDFTNTPPGADLLYALNGQPDSEGAVNYDIYIGFNRVVFGPGNRIGSGLAQVYLTLK